MNAHRTHVKARCPKCAQPLTGAMATDGLATPRPGDITICAYCLVALLFTETLELRLPTDDEWEKVTFEEVRMLEHARRTVLAAREAMQKATAKEERH